MINPFIFFIIWASFHSHYSAYSTRHDQNKFPALIYEIPENVIHFDVTKNASCFAFCPASTEGEKKFNDRVSITRRGLFLRNVHGPDENITANICEKPITPVMLYNSETHQYEIGYELYYEKDTFKLKNGTNLWANRFGEEVEKYHFGAEIYHIYRPVNNRNQVINNKKKYFALHDGSSKLSSHWISAVNVISSGNNKQIQIKLHYFTKKRKVLSQPLNEIVNVIEEKCEDYGLPRVDTKLYVSSNVDDNLKKFQNILSYNGKIIIPWIEQSNSSLELSQIIPLWYFDDCWAKTASCSHMNMIPVWKSIADGHLKKVDLYIVSVARYFFVNDDGWSLENIHFGTSGILSHKNKSGIDSNHREIYSSPGNAQLSKIIPVPKIIYRVIVANRKHIRYGAIVVIHNDPNPVPDSDRVCNKSEELESWEVIKNDDPRTGITYVCPSPDSKVTHTKLGFQITSDVIKPLIFTPLYANDVWYEYHDDIMRGI